jgi:hypothetical protein
MYVCHDITSSSKAQRIGFLFLTNFLLFVQLIPWTSSSTLRLERLLFLRSFSNTLSWWPLTPCSQRMAFFVARFKACSCQKSLALATTYLVTKQEHWLRTSWFWGICQCEASSWVVKRLISSLTLCTQLITRHQRCFSSASLSKLMWPLCWLKERKWWVALVRMNSWCSKQQLKVFSLPLRGESLILSTCLTTKAK